MYHPKIFNTNFVIGGDVAVYINTIAQHKNDCAVYGMPKAAVEVGAATFQYTTKSIIELISSIQFKACNLPPKKADTAPD